MSINSPFLQVFLTEIFERLAAGPEARTIVVTPNRRLALALKNQFDRYQATQCKVVWNSADILPFSAWVERIYTDALYTEQAIVLPSLLTAAQARTRWETLIRNSDNSQSLLAIPQTAKLAQQAWQLAHAWQLLPQLEKFPVNEDGKIFRQWMRRYVQITEQAQQIDAERLSDWVAEFYQRMSISKPACLICYGFDTFTPQQTELLRKVAAAGCNVMLAQPEFRRHPRSGDNLRVACIDSRDEIHRVAVWARARIEANNAARIGVVVPALAKYRNRILRIFSSVMTPDVEAALPNVVQPVMPFNVSLGVALTTCPLIATLFQVLTLCGREIDYAQVSLLLRSPFIGGGEAEMTKRALLDARLRKRVEPVVTLQRLLVLIKHEDRAVSCPHLLQQLSALVEFRQTNLLGKQAPSVFARNISNLLEIVGFSGERGLDSVEYQVLKKWHEVLAVFAALDNVLPTIGYGAVISQLRHLATETLFQPETPEVPIQILGILEADGLEFDHLWVMGLDDENWPLSPRPNPFLPIELQRSAKLPMSSTAESLVHSQRLTNGWLACADEVILSYSQKSDDGHALTPGSLIKSIAERALDLPVYETHRDRIQCMNELEVCPGDSEQTLNKGGDQNKAVSGGVAIIKDYAACPFRAFAKHRLKAESLSVPHTGLNALERGMLVHEVLALSWTQLETKNALNGIDPKDLDKLLGCAADKAIANIKRDRPTTLSGRFAVIEKKRLIRLVNTWLNEEKKRGDFTVIAIEEKRTIHIGGLKLNTRLDRVDQLDNGLRIIIDYKTQKQFVASLFSARPDEPQLPLYLVTAEPDAVALTFAEVKIGDMGFTGIARDNDLLPAIKAFSESRQKNYYDSWEVLIAAWRTDLTDLAIGFFNGDARVDPKKYPQTCLYCDMQPFCRIYERINASSAEQTGDE